jgi:hypothetical protein
MVLLDYCNVSGRSNPELELLQNQLDQPVRILNLVHQYGVELARKLGNYHENVGCIDDPY